MIEDNNFKCMKAIQTLKPNTECVIRHPIDNEANFNKIEWVTGTDDTGGAITTTTNPHSELTWTAVKEEMDKL
tara:strand:- start:1075 stop:1293 length:219 start_codon:yes stop_codon:yes gene_type:complete